MKTISIMWDDLTKEKQNEILKTFGDNCNYDVFPIAEIPVDEEDDQTSRKRVTIITLFFF